MKSRKYLVYDVFTEKALAGNPLGVVLECEGLDTEAMQAIAREFNLSESVFILPPDNPRHRARVRIFTPDYEMPFAGHPTVGAAVALAEQDDGAAGMFVLEENIGPVRCAVTFAMSVSVPAPTEISSRSEPTWFTARSTVSSSARTVPVPS